MVRIRRDMMNNPYSQFLQEIIEIILIVFALSWLLKTYLIGFAHLEGAEMMPTLSLDSQVLVEKYFYRSIDALDRGDVILYSDNGVESIKRVIGLPGEKVEIKNGYTYINNKPIYEPYANTPKAYTFSMVVVPEDHVFALNDNRASKNDSRSFGSVPIQSIEGKALFCYWPLSSVQIL
ncbi:Signal peptidase I [Dehalobacter sp. UNSWDHB]|uniref:signal peptidase I n=1 Tax=unclassified Dehalobacter TaxID=2635733 RepID=UPI00028AC3D0|nr:MULTISPECIES: signal peptidase I [unclassified Dehalobacter]AFV01640.1 Signal peptidase I [Dehalobacter sp. DCA]AFV04676.1 Signal peptidase I [Dehalobacter sp. CF]EQB21951.1 Signal peptidase I [Dehalobacter sp. UNSWDHB]